MSHPYSVGYLNLTSMGKHCYFRLSPGIVVIFSAIMLVECNSPGKAKRESPDKSGKESWLSRHRSRRRGRLMPRLLCVGNYCLRVKRGAQRAMYRRCLPNPDGMHIRPTRSESTISNPAVRLMARTLLRDSKVFGFENADFTMMDGFRPFGTS